MAETWSIVSEKQASEQASKLIPSDDHANAPLELELNDGMNPLSNDCA